MQEPDGGASAGELGGNLPEDVQGVRGERETGFKLLLGSAFDPGKDGTEAFVIDLDRFGVGDFPGALNDNVAKALGLVFEQFLAHTIGADDFLGIGVGSLGGDQGPDGFAFGFSQSTRQGKEAVFVFAGKSRAAEVLGHFVNGDEDAIVAGGEDVLEGMAEALAALGWDVGCELLVAVKG